MALFFFRNVMEHRSALNVLGLLRISRIEIQSLCLQRHGQMRRFSTVSSRGLFFSRNSSPVKPPSMTPETILFLKKRSFAGTRFKGLVQGKELVFVFFFDADQFPDDFSDFQVMRHGRYSGIEVRQTLFHAVGEDNHLLRRFISPQGDHPHFRRTESLKTLPGRNPAVQIVDFVEALAREELRSSTAAAAHGSVSDDRFLRVEFPQSAGQLGQGNKLGTGNVTLLVL